MEPSQDSIIARWCLGIAAGLPDRGLVDTGHDHNEPDIAGGEGAPLDTRQREWGNDFFRYVLDVRGRKVLVWIGDIENI
jgi:hypothetical protein